MVGAQRRYRRGGLRGVIGERQPVLPRIQHGEPFPGRRCPRRSHSIPTFIAGDVPPRASARSGFKFLDHDGDVARACFGSRRRHRSRLFRGFDCFQDRKCGRHRVTELQHPIKILSMPRFGLEKAPMRLRELWCTEGDGPGRCERGDRGHDRDRAFREKGPALYPICRRCGIKTLLTMGPGAGLFDFRPGRFTRPKLSFSGSAGLRQPASFRHEGFSRRFPRTRGLIAKPVARMERSVIRGLNPRITHRFAALHPGYGSPPLSRG